MCDLPTDCSDVVPFSRCVNNKCECLLGYMPVTNGSACEKSKLLPLTVVTAQIFHCIFVNHKIHP